MPAKKQDKVLVTCPRCGHQQPEPPAAISTVCKRCGQHIRVQELRKPAARSRRVMSGGRASGRRRFAPAMNKRR